MYNRRLKAGEIDADLVEDNANKLWEAVQKGWGKPIEKVPFASLEHRTLIQLRYSSYVTAVFKNHENILQTTALLFDDGGKLKPFRVFQKDALKVMDAYNKAYLQSEYQTAVQTATHASKWHQYQSRGGSLILRTQRDGRVRNEHRFYDGATYPVGHAFWDTWYPPNGWRCRCFVSWTNTDTIKEPDNLPTVVEAFNHNAGKQGTLFSDELSYFQVQAKYADKAKNLFDYQAPISPERFKANSDLYEQLMADKNYKLVSTDNRSGGVVFAHKQHQKKDYAENKKACELLASYGHGVVITEHIDRDFKKNPELSVDGELSDLKTNKRDSAGSVKGAFKSAKEQGINTFVMDTGIISNIETLIKGLKNGFYYNPSINDVLVIWKGKPIAVSRFMYEENGLAKAFE